MSEVSPRRGEERRPIVAYTPRKAELGTGMRRRAHSESSPPTQPREGLSPVARQSVEFLLCEVLDDIVNLPTDAMDDSTSEAESVVLEVTSKHCRGFRPWKSFGVVGGITVGIFVSVLLR